MYKRHGVADGLVAGEVDAVQGHDLGVVRALLPGPGGLAVAGEGEGVLLLAGDAVLVGDQFGALAQRDRPLRRHGRVGHAPAEGGRVHLLVAGGEGPLRLGQHPGRAAHGLHAARDHHGGVAERDGPVGLHDRLHAGGAQPVDGRAGHGHGQPGEQHGHAGDVAVLLPRAVGVAEDHVVDACRVQRRGPVDQGAYDVRGEVVGAYGGEGAAVPADRGADGVDDVHIPDAVVHGVSVNVRDGWDGGAVVRRSCARESSAGRRSMSMGCRVAWRGDLRQWSHERSAHLFAARGGHRWRDLRPGGRPPTAGGRCARDGPGGLRPRGRQAADRRDRRHARGPGCRVDAGAAAGGRRPGPGGRARRRPAAALGDGHAVEPGRAQAAAEGAHDGRARRPR